MVRGVSLALGFVVVACAGSGGAVRSADVEVVPVAAAPRAHGDRVPPDAKREGTIGATFNGVCHLERGHVRCAGHNIFGDIVPGKDEPSAGWHQLPDVADAVQLATGGGHVCVRRAGGAVICWGRDLYGELGRGDADPHSTTNPPPGGPGPVPALTDVEDIACGHEHTCARLRDGDIRCWGGASPGGVVARFTLDRAKRMAVSSIGATGVKTARLALGRGRSFAKTPNGWVGWTTAKVPPQLVPITGQDDADAFALGATLECSIAHGAVRCWQTDENNVWRAPLNPPTSELVQDLPPVSRVVAGWDHAVGLTADGRVYEWSVAPAHATEKPAVRGAIDVAAGHLFTCALMPDGTVKCWGEKSVMNFFPPNMVLEE